MMDMITFTLTVTILIGMVMIIRKVGKGKLKTKYMVFIWHLVILRLLVPFSVTCQLAPLNWMQSFTSNIRNSFVISHGEKGTEHVEQVPIIENEVEVKGVSVLGAVQESRIQRDVQAILLVIWAVGGVGLLSYFYFCFLRSNRIIREALVIDDALLPSEWRKEQKKEIIVYVSDRTASPITVGMFKGKIILPKHMVWNKEEMLNVLVHESIHIRQQHVLWKRIALLTLCMHWFNPLVWIMQRLFCKDIELACDEKVIEHIGDEKRKSYALSLINLAEQTRGMMFLESGFGKNDIEERVVAVMDGKRKSRLITILVLGVCMSGVGTSTIVAEKQKTLSIAQKNSAVAQQATVEGEKIAFDWYNDYKVFGMVYDREEDNFYYKEKTVCQFVDYLPSGDGSCRFFSRPVAGYSLEAIRDKKGIVTGLKEVGYQKTAPSFANDNEDDVNEDDENKYNKETMAWEERADEYHEYDEEMDETSEASELGDHKQDKEKYRPYGAYGITYNEKKHELYYNGKVVKVFLDIMKPRDSIYLLELNQEGEVLVEAVRDKNGMLTEVKTMDKERLKKLLKEEKSDDAYDFIDSILEQS